jgi:hypothetical protein
MIAAAPSRDSSLSLVRLLFSLAENPVQPVPGELKEHLLTVIQEAKALLADPNNVSDRTNRESIALALEMKSSQELSAAVEEITTFDSIDSVLAKRILKGMTDARPAY